MAKMLDLLFVHAVVLTMRGAGVGVIEDGRGGRARRQDRRGGAPPRRVLRDFDAHGYTYIYCTG